MAAITPEEAKKTLIDFAQSLEATVGTEDATALIKRLTRFINEAPEAAQQLRIVVKENETRFDEMLTRKGIQEIGELIRMVESGNFLSAFL